MEKHSNPFLKPNIDMPKGYEFQVASATIPKPSAQDVEKEIARLGFNKQAQSYKSPGNFKVDKIG